MEVRGPPLCKERKLYKFVGGATNTVQGVHNHSFVNVRRGLMERVYNVEVCGQLEPTPKPLISMSEFNARLARFVKKLLDGWSIPPRLDVDQCVDLWTGRKRAIYQRAADSLLHIPVGRGDAKLSTFVKAEKINLTKKIDPAPRVIQPRNPRYNLELARYLKHTEHLLFKKIDDLFDVDNIGERTIFKGMDAFTSARAFKQKVDRFSKPCFIGLDASRFDQHVSPLALGFEHSCWMKLCGGNRKGLSRLLKWQLENKGCAFTPDGFIKYKVNGCRMSGDINTSSGNCLIMTALCYSYMAYLGIGKYSLLNNGDDCVLIVEKSLELLVRRDLSTWFREMGFTMKVEDTVYDMHQVEFCQTRCLEIDGVFQFVRNMSACVSKDCHAVSLLSDEHKIRSWISAVGVGGRAANSGVPILYRFYDRFPRFVDSDREIDEFLQEYKQWRFSHCESNLQMAPINRYSCWRAFGITPDEQVAVEDELENWRVSTHPVDTDQPSVGWLDWFSTA